MKGAVFFAVVSLVAALHAGVSGQASFGAKSAFVNYGLLKGKDPIFVPAANVCFFDLVYLDAFALCDVTKGNGKRGGYGNRAGTYRKVNSSAGIRHAFNTGETLGRLVADIGYMYEYVHRYQGAVNDTQFMNVRVGLPDLWLEPSLWIERDLMLDDGTYVYTEIGHTFALTDAIGIRPAVGQGFGDANRSAAFGVPGFDHGGVMDTTARLELTISITESLSLGVYAAYHDYLFDSRMRSAARRANGVWGSGYERSWLFSGGVSAVLSF